MELTRYGTSPLGSPAQRRRPTIARSDLLKTVFEYLDQEPTTNEYEMLDIIISCMMWSYAGYKHVFNAAKTAHEIVHQETPPWILKEPKT